ncbi:MAG: LOG family protein [Alphaproteobacteria bacterium]|nr:LOG family protein [Alphaproteobacteria bacterium]
MSLHPTVSLFCGSAPAHTPELLAELPKLASQLATRQLAVRMGGMASGLMAQTGQALLAAGVPVTLVYPPTHSHEAAVPPHPLVHHQVVPNLAARVQFLSQSPLCVTLPGGLGTWHELFEAWLQLRPGQRLAVLNHQGYYTPLQQLLEQGQKAAYLRAGKAQQLAWCQTVAELEPLLP